MKLTAFILFIVSMHVSAHAYSQTVNFSGKNVPLQTVFASFEKQTGLSFFFNYALVKDIKLVTVEVREMSFEDALNTILKEQGLSYYRSGKTIFIVRQEVTATATPASTGVSDASHVDVTGRITNEQGEVLAGVSVDVKNGKRSTITNEKGVFELKNVSIGSTLVVSHTGYQKKEIEEQSVSNPLLSLEGRVPGLNITQANGMNGSSITVRIQGQNSIENGNNPFYVVDKGSYSSEALQGLSLAGENPLDYISPADIESITVLKDADATAIYGPSPANRAILIMTKKGKVGDNKVDINGQNARREVTRKSDLLDTQQYLEMRHEVSNNEGSVPNVNDAGNLLIWDTTRYTDWQKGNDPFYIIDGIPYSSQALQGPVPSIADHPVPLQKLQ